MYRSNRNRPAVAPELTDSSPYDPLDETGRRERRERSVGRDSDETFTRRSGQTERDSHAHLVQRSADRRLLSAEVLLSAAAAGRGPRAAARSRGDSSARHSVRRVTRGPAGALESEPIAVPSVRYRERLAATRDRLEGRDQWERLRAPADRAVFATGRHCRGIVHKVLADPLEPALISSGSRPKPASGRPSRSTPSRPRRRLPGSTRCRWSGPGSSIRPTA